MSPNLVSPMNILHSAAMRPVAAAIESAKMKFLKFLRKFAVAPASGG